MFNMIDPLLKTTPLGHPLFGGLQKGALFENSPNSLQEGVNPPSGGGIFPKSPPVLGGFEINYFFCPPSKNPPVEKMPPPHISNFVYKVYHFLAFRGHFKGICSIF